MHFQTKTLRTRIFSLIAPALLLLGAVISTTFVKTKGSVEADRCGIVELVAASGRDTTSAFLNTHRNIYSEWVQNNGDSMGMSIEFNLASESEVLFQGMGKQAPAFSFFCLLNRDGEVVARSGGGSLDAASLGLLKTQVDSALESEESVGAAVDNGTLPVAALGDGAGWLYADRVNDTAGNPTGVFFAVLDLRSLSDPVEKTKQLLASKGFEQADAVLIDERAKRILAGGAALEPSEAAELVKEVSSVDSADSRRIDVGGRTYFASSVIASEEPELVLVSLAPEDELLSEVYSMLTFNLLMSIVGAGILVYLYWWLSGRISRPVKNAADALARISEGGADASNRLEVHGRDELAHLATSFNELMVEIQGMLDEVELQRGELRRYKPMFRWSSSAIFYADTDRTIQQRNPAAERLCETLEGVLPVSGDAWQGAAMTLFHPDAQRVGQTLDSAPDQPYRERVTVGSVVFDTVICQLVGDEGEQLGWMLSLVDITEQVQAEDRVRQQAEASEQEARDLHEKIGRILEVVEAASQGDLTGSVSMPGDDEIAHLAKSLDDFFDTLRTDLGVILGTANELIGESRALDDASSRIAQAAEATSAKAKAAAGQAYQSTENSMSVAGGASELSASIREIASSSTTAAEVASRGVALSAETMKAVTELEDDSRLIGDVLDVINSIAKQTNLLALNATIEAARAGESGKGFAVVANEVKALAQETSNATEEIADRIQAIRNSSSRSAEAISSINSLIDEINQHQAMIAAAVEEQSATTSEIERDVERLASTGSEISTSLDSLSQGAEVTAQGVTDTRQTAERLTGMAAELQQLVGRFTLS